MKAHSKIFLAAALALGVFNAPAKAVAPQLGSPHYNAMQLDGKLTVAPSTTAAAPMNLGAGAAPTTPVNGDVWITSTGVYAYINGAVVGPLAGAASSIPTTSLTGTLQAAQMPAFTGDVTKTSGSLATTVTKTNGVSFGPLATLTPGTGVATALGNTAGGASGFALLNASGFIPTSQGGTGTGTPALVAGANITITGAWPNQTINATSGLTIGGTSGQVEYNNAGVLAGFTIGGDATLVPSTGVLTVTKTGGVAFGSLATASSVNLATQATGTLNAAQEPAFTGDVTKTAGSIATTVTKTNGVAFGALATVTAGAGVASAAANAVGGAGGFVSYGGVGSFSTLADTALSSAGMVTNSSAGVLGTVGYATATDIQTGSDATKPVTSAALSASQNFQSLIYGATTNWNMDLGYNATVTLGGNITTLSITNPTIGQTYMLLLVQDVSGSHTVTWPASINWGAAGVPTLTTTANKTDLVMLTCINTSGPLFYASVLKGY